MSLHIVILAGGSGTRLWPLSRRAIPKHLLPIHPSGSTLLAATVRRVRLLGAQISIVTTQTQVTSCQEALKRDGADGDDIHFIAEPGARGTGPALGLAMATLLHDDPDAVVSSVHADHYIDDDLAYCQSLQYAASWAVARHGLTTLAVTPTFPSTGFGYIQLGEELIGEPPLLGTLLPAKDIPQAYESVRFVEKPPMVDAERYLANGNYVWNTGVFSWEAQMFMEEVRTADAKIHDVVDAVAQLQREGKMVEAARAYTTLTPIAVDHLIMERALNLAVIRATFSWSDLGSWSDLREAWKNTDRIDDSGNILDGDVVVQHSENCFVKSESGRIIALVGMKDVVVVDTEDALLVLSADAAQYVKSIVDLLDHEGRAELL